MRVEIDGDLEHHQDQQRVDRLPENHDRKQSSRPDPSNSRTMRSPTVSVSCRIKSQMFGIHEIAKAAHSAPVGTANSQVFCRGSGKLLEDSGASDHAMRVSPGLGDRDIDGWVSRGHLTRFQIVLVPNTFGRKCRAGPRKKAAQWAAFFRSDCRDGYLPTAIEYSMCRSQGVLPWRPRTRSPLQRVWPDAPLRPCSATSPTGAARSNSPLQLAYGHG